MDGKAATACSTRWRMAQQQLAQIQQRYEELKAQIENEAPADAVKTTRDSVEKELSEHYGRAHAFKLKIQSSVTNKSTITPSRTSRVLFFCLDARVCIRDGAALR